MKIAAQVLSLLTWGLFLSLASALAEEKPLVVVSVPEQAYFIKRLAPDLVEVETIIPPGVTDETYEPGLAKLQSLKNSALFVRLGHPLLFLENAWLDNLKKLSPDLIVVSAIEGAAYTADDPHVWLSAKIAQVMANNSAVALKQLLPEQRKAIELNLTALTQEIAEVDEFLRELFKDSAGKAFLVFHPAWGYFARDYGLRQLAIEAEGKMPTPGGTARVIQEAKARRVRAVFIHPGHTAESADLIAAELGVKVVSINPLGENWNETMRSAGSAIKAGLSEDRVNE